MAWVEMRDFWTFRPKEVSENKRHLFECKDSKSDTGHSLLVHVAATHAGIINGNMRFYRPDKMQEGVHTWLPLQTKDGVTLRTPRPVLVGHDEKGSVLGRVLEAKYVDDSWRYAADFPVVKDFLFYQSQRDGKKRHNLFTTVDWIVDNLMPLDEYTGLGYTDLGVRITNPDAIRKVLADEYLTVSVGFKTDSAVCSLCHQDWAVDGKCEHKLGQMEDGHQMFLISGSFVNQELSFINFAADPFATTLSKKVLTDSLEKMFFLGLPLQAQRGFEAAGMHMTDGLYDADIVATEEPMEITTVIDPVKLREEIKDAGLTQEKATAIKTSLLAWQPETDELKTEKRSLVSTVNAKIRKNSWDKVEDANQNQDVEIAGELASLMEEDKNKKKKEPAEDPEEEEEDELDADGKPTGKKIKKKKGAVTEASNGMSGKKVTGKEAAYTKAAQSKEAQGLEGNECELDGGECNWDGYEFTEDEKTYFADAEGINEELELEIDAAVTDGELPVEIGKDAKLSTEARKKLGGGTFCGPGRSFPVPDCAHVTAARRLIGRAKVSDATKAKILSCVSGKAKKMGCGGAKKKDELTDEKALQRANKFVDALVQTDAVKAEPLSEEERGTLVSIVVSLDKAYDSLAAKKNQSAWSLRWLIRAMLTDWDADDEMRWALERLKTGDQIVLSASEVAEKEDALNGLVTEKDTLTQENSALKASRLTVLASSKRVLAQQIVMHSVLTGKDGYKDLTPEGVEEKVVELSKRHISSLKDSVSDILATIHWVKQDSASAAPSNAKPMDDNARIPEAAPVGSSATDEVQTEAQDKAIQDALQIRRRYMTKPEWDRYVAKLATTAQPKK